MAKTQEEIREKFKQNHPTYWKEYYAKFPNRWKKYYYKDQKLNFFKKTLSTLLTKFQKVLKLGNKRRRNE
jgi:hypothetical protein